MSVPKPKRILIVTIVGTALIGCGKEPPPVDDRTAMNNAIAALPAWPTPSPESEQETPLEDVTRTLDVGGEDVDFICSRTRHDVQRTHDEILNLGGSQTALKPGLLLQGAAFSEGVLRTIPLRRAPLTLSIDLPVSQASVVVDDPNTATLQEGISTLQVRAGEIAGDLPAMVSYQRTEVESMNQLALEVGAHSSYDSFLFDADFDSSLKMGSSRRQFTVVARLLQPMYTIAFADDAIATPAEFFADDVTAEDLETQQELGNLGDDNLPVFVSSVTYGRMVVFTATSTQAASSMQIQAALDLSVSSYKGGFELDFETQSFLSSLEIQVLALGGNSSAVSQAIVSGDYSLLFSNPDASSAVPLRYVVKNLAGARALARLGDATQFVVEECTPVSIERGWQLMPGPSGVLFHAVAVNKNGDAWAAASDGVYRREDGAWVMDTDLVFDDVTVDDEGVVYGTDTGHRPWRRTEEGWALGAGLLLQLTATDDGVLYGLGTDSKLYVSYNWPSWTNINSGWTFHDIALASPERLYLVSGYRGNPGGATYWLDLTYHNPLHVLTTAPTIQQLAAASTAEVYALTNGYDLRALDLVASTWIEPSIDPLPEAPAYIAATSNADLWIVTGSGRIYHYLP